MKKKWIFKQSAAPPLAARGLAGKIKVQRRNMPHFEGFAMINLQYEIRIS